MMKPSKKFLEHKAYNLRVSSLRMTTEAGAGHITSSLSAADIVATVFFQTMRFDPHNHGNPDNDRFVLSKGHAVPVLYAVWKELGVLSEKELLTYRDIDSILEGHPTLRFDRNEAATGSLGQGLSIGLGMSLSAHMDNRDFRTYVLMGDSEIAEGSVWEAAAIASHYKIDSLTAIVDVNRLGQANETLHGHDMKPYEEKFKAFGWHTISVDGHDVEALVKAFDTSKKETNKPSVILAKTIKGYGIKEVEDKQGFHGKAFKKEQLKDLLQELKHNFKSAADPVSESWNATIPVVKQKVKASCTATMPSVPFKRDDMIATRVAYGKALAALGDVCSDIVSLDAEVKNSTFAELFEQKHPERFVQCFIAEQNMVGMAVGLAARYKMPFVSTFAAFLTRAFDQIRMASIGQARLNIVGSHVGVSIGSDGPSQMGLEDISMMRTIQDSIILYPCDAVSTWSLVEKMAHHHDSVCYLRTTRAKTPVIYDDKHIFKIGGCSVLKHSSSDKVCIVAAGITVVEALKSYKILKKDGISVAIIDLYSIKPFDVDVVMKIGKQANKEIIVVEDHYAQGGIGEMIAAALCDSSIQVTSLAVTRIPRSGTKEQLMAFEEIDANAIVKEVKKSK